ncbi:hypothetical protein L6R53_16295 [Myxococcota bacterium]|nr:hypothetical protein [Myxococcota bacterium]
MSPFVRTWIHGADADPSAPPDLLCEVPHAAWRRAHYDAARAALAGELPADLHAFFHVNTDVGAEALALAVAQALVEADPTRSAVVLACRVPRTFIDCNRVIDADPAALTAAGLTAGLPVYVRDPRDQALLLDLHRRYVREAERLHAWVCGAGGVALSPHSYAPRDVPIEQVTDRIVDDLRRVYDPAVVADWPLRPPVDLISVDGAGRRVLSDALVQPALEGYRALGLDAGEGRTYPLHPATQAARFAALHPGRTLCLELRRDLLVRDWRPFEEMRVDDAAIERLAGPLVAAVRAGLGATG